MNKKYIDIMKKLVKKALKYNEVPVAALLVYNKKIVSKSYNKRIKSNNVLMHAEIDAIIKACKKMKDWRLDKCILYVTLKPCKMCTEIIKAARIKKVYYLVESEKETNFDTEFIKEQDDYIQEYKETLINFFKEKR